MAELNVLNSKFENSKKISFSGDLGSDLINVPVVHQVVKALLASRRQGNAATKNKSAVSGGGKKPFKQKGTGNARQGSSRSPLMPGGGTVFGPSPRSYEQKINKKMMLIAIRSVLVDKYLAGKLTIVDSIKTTGKTSEVAKLLSSKSLLNSLIVFDGENENLVRATNNLPRVRSLPIDSISVYEAVKHENLIIELTAFEKLTKKLGY
jgi:large subunit ribosomal protein L4